MYLLGQTEILKHSLDVKATQTLFFISNFSEEGVFMDSDPKRKGWIRKKSHYSPPQARKGKDEELLKDGEAGIAVDNQLLAILADETPQENNLFSSSHISSTIKTFIGQRF